jgi:hypothetical protein
LAIGTNLHHLLASSEDLHVAERACSAHDRFLISRPN